ncbi:MAG: thiolase family protein [Deltaproteobacteria bacterium]|jgi:acetyl-CoA acyltransferase|nr:thiolase family protein [Deltaproteobacteria bacterium]
MKPVFILNAKRTPGGKAPRGQFSTVRPDELAAIAIKAVLDGTGIDPAQIDDVIFGCAFPEAEQGMNIARVAALRAGIPVQVPAMTINRFCASGLQAVAAAAERIAAGLADCIIAGGTESMSLIPMGGHKFSANPNLVSDWPECYAAMGITAEILAKRYAISRTDQDLFAVESHHRASEAMAAGRFAAEIVPVPVRQVSFIDGDICRESRIVVQDEGVRAQTSIDNLTALKPVFKIDGTVTAGNASQMTDGAAALLVASEAFLKQWKCDPVARFASYAVRGVAPEVMGIGPVEAVPVALQRAGLKMQDLDVIELNEAFAVQALAVIRDLDFDPLKVNVNGGAIALGHPLGCTGAKLSTTLLAEMGRRRTRYGMVTMCVGGGMGAAGVFERF